MIQLIANLSEAECNILDNELRFLKNSRCLEIFNVI